LYLYFPSLHAYMPTAVDYHPSSHPAPPRPSPPNLPMVVARPGEGVNLLQVGCIKRNGSAEEMETNKPDSKMEDVDEENEQPTQKLRPKGRRIQFYPGVSVRECLHINNFTDDEVYQSWFRRKDYQRIKTSFQYIVQRISNNTWQGDTNNETMRGLEYRHREGSMKRKANKLNGLMAVLDEQERQWRRDVDDDVAISEAYMAVGKKSSLAARMLAAKDEIEVKEMWKYGDVESVSSGMSDVSMHKRKDAPEEEHNQKKTRLKAFMKKIQTAQRVGRMLTANTNDSAPKVP